MGKVGVVVICTSQIYINNGLLLAVDFAHIMAEIATFYEYTYVHFYLLLQDKVRPNDLWSLLFSAGRSSPRSRQLVWEFVQEKWEWLKDRYQGSFLLGRVVEVRGELSRDTHNDGLYNLLHTQRD